jgi:UDP-glucose 4-epimerase
MAGVLRTGGCASVLVANRAATVLSRALGGHFAAAAAALADPDGGSPGVLNVGRNEGVSVLEMVAAVEAATGRSVPHRVAPRRAGDPARVVADAGRIAEVLGWRARRDLAAMALRAM